MEHGSCRHLLDSLSEYIDGELEKELCMEIDRHLQSCENCRIVVDSLRKTVSLYGLINESLTMPEEVRERLFMRLDLEEFLGRSG